MKKRLSADERYGLTDEQVNEAEKYLRKHGEQGIPHKQDVAPMHEMSILGYSFEDVRKSYPSMDMGQLILAAAVYGWAKDRDTVANSVLDRIKTRIVRSTVEQVDLLSGLISVYNVETNEQIRLYLQDPQNNPLPSNRIANIKELKSVVEMLAEVTESVRSLAQPQPLQQQQKLQQPNKPKALPKKDEHALLAELVEEDE
jgi:hypothetical protein